MNQPVRRQALLDKWWYCL